MFSSNYAAEALQLHAGDHTGVVDSDGRHELRKGLLAHMVATDLISERRVGRKCILTRLVLTVEQAGVAAVGSQSAQVDVEANADADAVSVLLSGNVVGSDRGALGGLRRPASAFVP